ncbi:hypothetical protein [Variovorax sp. E3]|uniref:hypothetical protein n=1 Tax=Variovorax sp. E3 TaxID=1914993 RepID=UPI0018DB930B|nr:hypothetical protein [Variovorax sp. E3]
MAKRQPQTSPAVVESDNVVGFEISDNVVAFAADLGVDLTGSLEERADHAAQHMNRSQRHMLAAGLYLASMKADCEHGEFTALIEARGFEERSAQRAMQYTQFVLSRPEDERRRLLETPSSKVLALASADPEVIEDLLKGGEDSDLNTLSVRELRLRIRELEAAQTDAAVQFDTVVAERDGLAKKLKKRVRDAEDHEGTPVVIADIRAELAALTKKGELSIDSMHPVLVELAALGGNELAGDWVKPSVRLAMSGLVALRLQIDGVIKSCADMLGDKITALSSQPDALAFLDQDEVKAVAEEWARLTSTHGHEAELRKHERKQAQPRGKGRPEAPPKAPKA